MDIKEYRKEIIEHLKNAPELVNSDICDVDITKANDVSLNAVSIKKDKESKLGVNLYIDEYYKRNMSVEDAAKDMIRLYKENIDNQTAGEINSLIDTLQDFEKTKDKIIIRVFNKERNKNFVNDHPYLIFGDLVIVFYVEVTPEAVAMVTNSMLSTFGVSLQDLINVSFENTRRLYPVVINNMFNTLLNMTGVSEEELANHGVTEEDNKMYVVSNKNDYYGASYLADKESLNTIYKHVKSNFFIIPSSIHELIIVPINEMAFEDNENKKDSIENLNYMIREVNQTTLQDSEILSDHVYFYNGKEEKLYDDKDKAIPFIY